MLGTKDLTVLAVFRDSHGNTISNDKIRVYLKLESGSHKLESNSTFPEFYSLPVKHLEKATGARGELEIYNKHLPVA